MRVLLLLIDPFLPPIHFHLLLPLLQLSGEEEKNKVFQVFVVVVPHMSPLNIEKKIVSPPLCNFFLEFWGAQKLDKAFKKFHIHTKFFFKENGID